MRSLIMIVYVVFFLAACSSSVLSESSLVVGEVKQVAGLRLSLLNIVEDSRCPVGVQCIWAGRVVANVSVAGASWFDQVLVSSDTPVVLVKPDAQYTLQVVNIFPDAGAQSDRKAYRLTFRVTTERVGG